MSEHLDLTGEYMGPVPIDGFTLGPIFREIDLRMTIGAYMHLNTFAYRNSGRTIEELIAIGDDESQGILHDTFQLVPKDDDEQSLDILESRVPGMILEDTDIAVYVYPDDDRIPWLRLKFTLQPPNLA